MEGKQMKKKISLIGVSIIAVVLLVLGSLTNVVGYQQVQSSNQNTINDEVNQKELLFQTICDIANNNEIQRVILKSQIIKEGFFDSRVKFPGFITPVLTKNQLKYMYVIGLILSKIINKSKIHSMFEQMYQISNQGAQKKITTVIEKDSTLKQEMVQLSTLRCDCGNDNTTFQGGPILCMTLALLAMALLVLQIITGYFSFLYAIIYTIGVRLHC
jgi:hypothetical protein